MILLIAQTAIYAQPITAIQQQTLVFTHRSAATTTMLAPPTRAIR
jgi:hypothetical protein